MNNQIKTFDANKSRSLVEEMLVPHTAFQEATRVLEQAFEAAPTIRDPFGYFIAGESRTGKSRLIEEFQQAHLRSRTELGLQAPVVNVVVPSKPSVKGLAAEILRALGDPLAHKGTEQDMNARLLIFLKQCGVRVLILDEAQHLVDKSSKYALIHHVSDWLKNLMNRSKVVVVIAGLHYAQTVLSQNEQLRGRFAQKIILPRFQWQDPKLRVEFRGLLKGFNQVLSERFDLPDLSSQEMALRFYLASGGLTGYVFNILRKTIWNMIDEERTAVEMTDFDIGYREMVSSEDQQAISPFSPDFDINDGLAFEKAEKIGSRSDDYTSKK